MKWKSTIAAFMDEVSMISSEQFHQSDVRMRQAMMNSEHPFGGLAVNICGDFLQLPPVDKDGSRRSLAMPHDAVEPPEDCDEHVDDPKLSKKRRQAQKVVKDFCVGSPSTEWFV